MLGKKLEEIENFIRNVNPIFIYAILRVWHSNKVYLSVVGRVIIWV